jgi:hypothetical protein
MIDATGLPAASDQQLIEQLGEEIYFKAFHFGVGFLLDNWNVSSTEGQKCTDRVGSFSLGS